MYNREGYKAIGETAEEIGTRLLLADEKTHSSAPSACVRKLDRDMSVESPAKKSKLGDGGGSGGGGGGGGGEVSDGEDRATSDWKQIPDRLCPPSEPAPVTIKRILMSLEYLKRIPVELVDIITQLSHTLPQFEVKPLASSEYKRCGSRFVLSSDGKALIPELPIKRSRTGGVALLTRLLILAGQPLRHPKYHLGGSVWSDRMGFGSVNSSFTFEVSVEKVWGGSASPLPSFHLWSVRRVEYRASCEHCDGRACFAFVTDDEWIPVARGLVPTLRKNGHVLHRSLPSGPIRVVIDMNHIDENTRIELF
jgi:hypothetical protein